MVRPLVGLIRSQDHKRSYNVAPLFYIFTEFFRSHSTVWHGLHFVQEGFVAWYKKQKRPIAPHSVILKKNVEMHTKVQGHIFPWKSLIWTELHQIIHSVKILEQLWKNVQSMLCSSSSCFKSGLYIHSFTKTVLKNHSSSTGPTTFISNLLAQYCSQK